MQYEKNLQEGCTTVFRRSIRVITLDTDGTFFHFIRSINLILVQLRSMVDNLDEHSFNHIPVSKIFLNSDKRTCKISDKKKKQFF